MPYYRYNAGGWQPSQRQDNETINVYMWDVTSCLFLLKHCGLDRQYRVVATPGHHMHMANVYNMLGGVTIMNELNHFDTKTLTLMMKCIVDQGTPPIGGINLKLVPRRDGDLRELVTLYVKYMDAIAKGLRLACAVIAEQSFVKQLQQRYATYHSGFGARIVSSDISLEECEEQYKKNQSHGDAATHKYEHLDVAFQRHIDTCDHI